MSPIIQSLANGSARGYGAFLAAAAAATSYDSIATITVGSGGATSAEFTSIPGTYTHLQIRAIGRGAGSNTDNGFYFRLNSDSGTNYTRHRIRGDGSSASASANTAADYAALGGLPAGGASASIFGTFVIDILDYANTNKYTTIRSLVGEDRNGAGNIILNSNLWLNTNAVTSILLAFDGPNLAQYSHFALYGIKGA
jgi:hypothetical protein